MPTRLPQVPTTIVEVCSAADADLSAHVQSMLDAHVAALQSVRQRLRMGGTTTAGGRRALALESAAVAACFAQRMSLALGLPTVPSGPACPRMAAHDQGRQHSCTPSSTRLCSDEY